MEFVQNGIRISNQPGLLNSPPPAVPPAPPPARMPASSSAASCGVTSGSSSAAARQGGSECDSSAETAWRAWRTVRAPAASAVGGFGGGVGLGLGLGFNGERSKISNDCRFIHNHWPATPFHPQPNPPHTPHHTTQTTQPTPQPQPTFRQPRGGDAVPQRLQRAGSGQLRVTGQHPVRLQGGRGQEEYDMG